MSKFLKMFRPDIKGFHQPSSNFQYKNSPSSSPLPPLLPTVTRGGMHAFKKVLSLSDRKEAGSSSSSNRGTFLTAFKLSKFWSSLSLSSSPE